MKISPSILSADFLNLESEIKKIEKYSDYIHIDVMDGNFVPNITVGPNLIKRIKELTNKPLDVHIMVSNPDESYKWYLDAGADILTFHIEASKHSKKLLEEIKNCGIKAGISINPKTPISDLEHLLGYFDLLLTMTVDPGFGGQKLIEKVLEKIDKAKLFKKKHNFEIEVDGGVDISNINRLKKLGVDTVVAGSAIFSNKNPELAIQNLLKEANK